MKTIIDTLKEPVNVLNATTFGVSLSTLPEDLKIVFYIVSIIASILVSVKYVVLFGTVFLKVGIQIKS